MKTGRVSNGGFVIAEITNMLQRMEMLLRLRITNGIVAVMKIVYRFLDLRESE